MNKVVIVGVSVVLILVAFMASSGLVSGERGYGKSWWEVKTRYFDGTFNVVESPKASFNPLQLASQSFCSNSKEIVDIDFILKTNLDSSQTVSVMTFKMDAIDSQGNRMNVLPEGAVGNNVGHVVLSRNMIQNLLSPLSNNVAYVSVSSEMLTVKDGVQYKAVINDFRYYLQNCGSVVVTTTVVQTSTTTIGGVPTTTTSTYSSSSTRTTSLTSTTTTTTTTSSTSQPPVGGVPCWFTEPASSGSLVDVSCDRLGFSSGTYDYYVQNFPTFPVGYVYKNSNIGIFLNAHPGAGTHGSTAGGTIPSGYQITWFNGP